MILPRRAAFFGLVLLTAAVLFWLLLGVLAPGGWGVAKLALLLSFAPVALWFGVCVGNAVPGFLLLLCASDPPRAVLPVAGDIETAPIHSHTALLVTVRHEDMAAVLPPLGRLLAGLADTGAGAWFTPWILSDSTDPLLAEAEAAAVAAFPGTLRYRRRTDNSGFKAGNAMEFLDHHAEGLEFAVMLDADSEMSAEAVLRLVRIMQAAPRMGLVQHLVVGRPTEAAFPRLFQFGMRAGMRVWATGQAWWQGDEGPYWGHNAILRIAPFRAHCRLAPLPDGSAILSHDQLEAALLRAAGWSVCVWAGEAGSQESNPPALPEFLHRDTRWLAGNLQYRHLIARPGLRPLGRWQLAQAMLMFAVAPALTAMLPLAALLAATGTQAPPDHLLALLLAAALAVHSPKLLGYAEVLLSAPRAARYGGRRRFALGAAVEILFTTLLDPITALHRALAIARHMLGGKSGWAAQNRGPRGVGWGEALGLFWPHTLFGLAVFTLFAGASWHAVLWALPFAGGLLLAVPLAVASSSQCLAAALQSHHLIQIPEETTPVLGAAAAQPCACPSPMQ
jgi:membrane glycosyltransferase